MTAETLLRRLDCVRSVGRSQWVARCPAHDDRGPSLSIAEADDGRVLIHDFAGCSPAEVLDAIGVQWEALFPERDPDDAGRRTGWRTASARGSRQRRSGISARAALVAIHADVLEAAVLVADVAEGRATIADARTQLWTLAGRIADALEVSGGADAR